MIGYIDSSVLIRIIFREQNHISDMSKFDKLVSSRLITTECFRTLHRLSNEQKISEDELFEKSREMKKAFSEINLIDVSAMVLSRAMHPFPTHVKTLDSIHLSSALIWKESQNEELIFLTHDDKLGKAASILGFDVFGSANEKAIYGA